MNILIPNSWLKEYLDTDATPQQFADAMSLSSVSIERIEKVDDDFVYDIEVTTNRPDLMSIMGIALEASAVLPQQGYKAKFKPGKIDYANKIVSSSDMLTIESDKKLVNRIMAIVLEVELGPSPAIITDRLTKTGIRSINNVVDVTNYIMREVGHPSHVFDYDRLKDHKLIIRESKKGERIVTLDDKEYTLPGGDIVADNGTGEIIDLLGIMGTANSVVTDNTKRIVLFLDNNEPNLLRKTSMNLGIRTEAAVLNEKGVNPDIMFPTLLTGVELLIKNANAKVLSPIIDIYPNKVSPKTIQVSKNMIDTIIGIEIPEKTITEILTNLGFTVKVVDSIFSVEVFTSRINDIQIPEDIVEEVARVYGYHKIPNILPPSPHLDYYHQDKSEFYWITKIKNAFKFWGFNEVYTYSLVSESLFDGPIEEAVKLKNPLDNDHEYLRNSLTPGLMNVASENERVGKLQIFEISNVYLKKEKGLPNEVLHLAGLIRHARSSFYEAKGVVEQVLILLGITQYEFQEKKDGIEGAYIIIGKSRVGLIEIDEDAVSFEIDLSTLLGLAVSQKKYIPTAKFPPIIEDVRVELAEEASYDQIVSTITKVSPLISNVSLLDQYENKKTFRITFLNREKNLTNEEIVPVRELIYKALKKAFNAHIG